MKVSVILTTHGEGRHLKQAIGSVLAQTFQDWELLIARDGVDFPPWGESSYFLKDARISLLGIDVPEGVNRYAYTINQAFQKCQGEYITYLCHDDLYLPWRLEFMARALDHNDPKADVIYGWQQLLHEEPDGRLLLGKLRGDSGTTFSAALKVDHSSVMHRRECFEKAGGWDENAPMRYGDAYFWTRLNSAGYPFVPIGVAPMDCHRFNSESVTHKIIEEKKGVAV